MKYRATFVYEPPDKYIWISHDGLRWSEEGKRRVCEQVSMRIIEHTMLHGEQPKELEVWLEPTEEDLLP